MKKLMALLLLAALMTALALPAFAAEVDETAPDGEEDPFGYAGNENSLLIAPNPNASGAFGYTFLLNGEVVDTSAVPAGEGVPVPFLTGDGDYCLDEIYYFHDNEEFSTWFFFKAGRVIADDATGAIRVENEDGDFEDSPLTAVVSGGYILLPTELLTQLGYQVTVEGDTLSVSSPAESPLAVLGRQIIEASDCYAKNLESLEYIMPNYDVGMENFEDGCYFSGFMTTPDCLIIAKLAEGADEAAIRAALEAYLQSQHDTFSWYLDHHLYKVEEAQLVLRDGYAMLLIADNSAAGLEVFNAFLGVDTSADSAPEQDAPEQEQSPVADVPKTDDGELFWTFATLAAAAGLAVLVLGKERA